jgi:hypothetical protein
MFCSYCGMKWKTNSLPYFGFRHVCHWPPILFPDHLRATTSSPFYFHSPSPSLLEGEAKAASLSRLLLFHQNCILMISMRTIYFHTIRTQTHSLCVIVYWRIFITS